MTKLMTPLEAADMLRLESSTLNKWRVTGKGPPHIRVGGRIMYDHVDIEQWIASRRVTSTSVELA